MAHSVGRDPFSRGEYERRMHGPGECHWCGQERKHLFSYLWVGDDRAHRSSYGSLDHAHHQAKKFCNFQCFKAYNL